MNHSVLEVLEDLLYRLCLRKHGHSRLPLIQTTTGLHMPAVWLTTKIGNADFSLIPRMLYTGRLTTFDNAVDIWREIAELAVTPEGNVRRIRTLLTAVVPELVEAHGARATVQELLLRFLVVASWAEGAEAFFKGNRLEVRCGPRTLVMDGPLLGWRISRRRFRYTGHIEGLTPQTAPALGPILTSPLRQFTKVYKRSGAVLQYLYAALPGMGREVEAVFAVAALMGDEAEKKLIERFEVVAGAERAAQAELEALIEFNNQLGKK